MPVPQSGKYGGNDMYYIYILKSTKVNRYYIGCTSNIARRLNEHNSGKVSSTKAYSPWILIYTENFEDKSDAYKREKEIKSYKSGFKFKEIIKHIDNQIPA